MQIRLPCERTEACSFRQIDGRHTLSAANRVPMQALRTQGTLMLKMFDLCPPYGHKKPISLSDLL